MPGKRRRSDEAQTQPDGTYHYTEKDQLSQDLQKYFSQRYDLFSKYDDGIWMTESAWFGVTPEPVARKIAEELEECAQAEKLFVIDAFAGVGGNAIAFALSGRWKRVYAIERDSSVLACAKHNASVYGVEHLITWLEGDCFSVIPEQLQTLAEHAVVFASPPWGGPTYQSDEVFDLTQMKPYNLQALMTGFQALTGEIILYLPRTSDIRQLVSWHTEASKLWVTHYCLKGASKAMCAYFGSLSEVEEE